MLPMPRYGQCHGMGIDNGPTATAGYWERRSRARPLLFPVVSAGGRRYTGASAPRPGDHLGQNVDSLHILSGAGRPPNVSLASGALIYVESRRRWRYVWARSAACSRSPRVTVSRSPQRAHLIPLALTAIFTPF